jgi:hypothetical protein
VFVKLDLETYGTSEDNKIRKVEGRAILGRRRLINQEASNLDCFQAKTNLVVHGVRGRIKNLSENAWSMVVG